MRWGLWFYQFLRFCKRWFLVQIFTAHPDVFCWIDPVCVVKCHQGVLVLAIQHNVILCNRSVSPTLGCEAKHVQLYMLPYQRRQKRLGRPSGPLVRNARYGPSPYPCLRAFIFVCIRLRLAGTVNHRPSPSRARRHASRQLSRVRPLDISVWCHLGAGWRNGYSTSSLHHRPHWSFRSPGWWPEGPVWACLDERSVREPFYWSTLQADTQAFVRACIHCISTVRREKIPRPFGPAVHGTKPNDLLQLDYIELGPTERGHNYVLMLRDDHSDYKLFIAFPTTNSENAAAIIEWCAAFRVPNGLMSDGPTHFKNEVVCLVTKGLKVPHHFTLPYCPWSNGAVERLGR